MRAKTEFLQRLETTISRATQFGQFAQEAPLNLANRTGRSTVEQEFDEQLTTAKCNHQAAEKALSDKRLELTVRGATPADLARILPEYDRAVTRALQELNQISARKFEVKDAAKNQASLFGMGEDLSQVQNTFKKFEGERYELFWTSRNAQHLSDRNRQDPKGHPLLHEDAAKVVVSTSVAKLDRRAHYRLLGELNGVLYVAVVKFVKHLRGNRCIVVTCYLGRANHQKEYEAENALFR